MTNRIATAAAAIALLAGAAAPAFASDQLALSLGVEPGAYTTAQLIDLRAAREDRDQAKVNYILSQRDAAAARVSTSGRMPAADVQRSAIAGVAPGSLDSAALTQLRAAREEGDRTTAAYILSGSPSSPDAREAAKARLASVLRVDPADYSLAELHALSERGE